MCLLTQGELITNFSLIAAGNPPPPRIFCVMVISTESMMGARVARVWRSKADLASLHLMALVFLGSEGGTPTSGVRLALAMLTR